MSENCTHNCETCGDELPLAQNNTPRICREKPHALSSIKKVIGVVSGKGGVGKSMTSAMLAVLLNRRGYHTAVLDADITGPCIPKLFGIHGRAHAARSGHAIPCRASTGIDVMSVNLLLEHETRPCRVARARSLRAPSSSSGRTSSGRMWISCLWTCLRERATCR